MKNNKLALFAAALIFFSGPATAAGDTEWLVAPYLWYPSISLNQSSDSGGGGISAGNLLEKTDAVGMIRIEAARNKWGFTLDYIYLSLADEGVFDLPQPFNGTFNLRAELTVSVLEAGGFYRPSGSDKGIDYLFGLRTISTEKTLLVTPQIGGPTQRFDGDADVTDVFLGARYLHRFGDRWDLTIRGDYSFGDSEGTMNLLGSAGFRFNDLFGMNVGYRFTNMEFEDTIGGQKETTEIEFTGPFLGFVFRF